MTTTPNTQQEFLAPPTERYTILGWLYKNFFRTWYDSLLTLGAGYLIYSLIKSTYIWLTSKASLSALAANMQLFMVGQYGKSPELDLGIFQYESQVWRIWLCVYILATLIGMSFGAWKVKNRFGFLIAIFPLILIILNPWLNEIILPNENVERVITLGIKPENIRNLWIVEALGLIGFLFGTWRGKSIQRVAITSWILYFPLIIFLIRGISEENTVLPVVKTNLWGGLLLSLLLAIVGIVASFPIGVLLALGRRSNLPLIKGFCIVFIEFVRGVPLITILFMSSVMLQLFLPPEMPSINQVIRAMTAITFFSAAYLAENVRGGLQAIPGGQTEAAQALGLSGFQTTMFIVLPQAIRAVIPAIVGQFIGLFKDTSLVAIVGLLDLLGIANTVNANPRYLGSQRETYLFITLIYWIFSYALAYTSRRLEKTLGVGER